MALNKFFFLLIFLPLAAVAEPWGSPPLQFVEDGEARSRCIKAYEAMTGEADCTNFDVAYLTEHFSLFPTHGLSCNSLLRFASPETSLDMAKRMYQRKVCVESLIKQYPELTAALAKSAETTKNRFFLLGIVLIVSTILGVAFFAPNPRG